MKKDSLFAPILLIGAMLLCCGGHLLAALGGFGVFAGLATEEYAFVIGGVIIAALGIGLRIATKKHNAMSTSDSSCCDSPMKKSITQNNF